MAGGKEDGRVGFAERLSSPIEPRSASRPSGLQSSRGAPFEVLSLFAGVGGLDLGLERTGGFRTVAACEIDPFCQRVLAKNWPGVPIYHDVRSLSAERLRADGITPNVIVGGFPCQDISHAGTGAGLAGERSGLWSEYARLVGELGPQLVIVENVAALLGRGIDTVLGAFSDLGFDAEWDTVSACSVGHPHVRRRVFIVAYSDRFDGRERLRDSLARAFRAVQAVDSFESARARSRARLANPSALYRGADGLPDCMDRNRAIGNAVVPDIAEVIGRAILKARNPSQADDLTRLWSCFSSGRLMDRPMPDREGERPLHLGGKGARAERGGATHYATGHEQHDSIGDNR